MEVFNIFFWNSVDLTPSSFSLFFSSGFSVGNTVAVNHPTPFIHPTPFVLSMSKDEWRSGQALRLSKPAASFIELGDLGELTETPQPNLPASVLPSSSDSNL